VTDDRLEDKQRNGSAGKFDKLMRRDLERELKKIDGLKKLAPGIGALVGQLEAEFADIHDQIDVLRKHAPPAADMVEAQVAVLANILDRLEKIEQTEAAHRAQPSRLVPGRERTPDELLSDLRQMSPEARALTLQKLK
jgi:hypothetical protein